MKFTLSWLKDYFNSTANLEEICDKLNNIGLEVENIEEKAKNLTDFSVAKIIKANPHPDSKKLKICQVDVGESKNLQIICGAKNARDGLKVAYAPIGSVIPTNLMKIKKAKIAGVESFGMLCSAVELGLGDDSEGIIEIDDKFSIGSKISEIFGLDDVIIEVNITPNRGDCLGVLGIARDLSATGIGNLKLPEIKEIKGQFPSPIKASLKSKNCPYFCGYYIKNVQNQPSPKWLKERLEAIGCNSISAIVDITNYTMFCLNQPIHSYDADKLSGDILVRDAKKNEEFLSLKENNYQLSGEEITIADDEKIIGLAGIIGGLNSITDDKTTNIFLEAAFFEAEAIAQAGRYHNILSDARYRFERSVDLENVKNALNFAANLIIQICGGQISQMVTAGKDKKAKTTIDFDLSDIKQILGIEIPQNIIVKILQDLQFEMQDNQNGILKITPPSHRSDIAIAQDVIEEIIRIYGFNHIESFALNADANKARPVAEDVIRNKLVANGLNESINYSFIDSKIAALFSDVKEELKLQNPIAMQMDYMRPNLLIGLLKNIAKNQARNFENLSFFEIGKIFTGVRKDQQKNIATAIRIGKNKPASHYKDERSFDVFDIKKDLLDCLIDLGFSPSSFQITSQAPNYYHPYRSAALKLGNKIIAFFGELHPAILKKLDVKEKANAFELFLQELPINLNKKNKRKAFEISDLQTVNRDFAFVIDEDIAIGDLLSNITKIDKKLISQVDLFDIYQGENLGKNKKSIAFSVKLQPFEKTLTGEEIDQISNKIIKMVEEKFSGILRG